MAWGMLVGLNVTDDFQDQEYRKSKMPILHAHGGDFGYDFKVSEVLLSQTDSKINRVFTIYLSKPRKYGPIFFSIQIILRSKKFILTTLLVTRQLLQPTTNRNIY